MARANSYLISTTPFLRAVQEQVQVHQGINACLTPRWATVWPSPDNPPRTHLRPKGNQASSEYPTRSSSSLVSRTLIGLVNASAGFVFLQTFRQTNDPASHHVLEPEEADLQVPDFPDALPRSNCLCRLRVDIERQPGLPAQVPEERDFAPRASVAAFPAA